MPDAGEPARPFVCAAAGYVEIHINGSEGGGEQITAGDRGKAARRRPYDEVVGPKGKHNPERTAMRHGHEDGSMTLGGRRVQVRRPRMRTADDEQELPVSTYEHFSDRDPLTRASMDCMLGGVSTRRFQQAGEPSVRESSRRPHRRQRRRYLRCSSSAPAPRSMS